MKKVLAGITLLSFLFTTACNTVAVNDNQLLSQNEVNSFAKQTKTDWYESLSPELQTYYAEAKGKTGSALFDSLHTIINRGVKISGYGDSKSFMYAVADNTTVNNKTGLFDAYSDIFVPGSGGDGGSYKESGDQNKDGVSGDFINCEHTWPQSFFGKQLPMVADIHHLQSTMSVPNNRRGHLPIGMATGKIIYSTSGGSKLGVSDSSRKVRTEAEMKKIFSLPEGQYEDKITAEFGSTPVFEPLDRQKGNTARCLLYFYLMYYDKSIRQGGFQKGAFWTSKVSTFINWSEKTDPVNTEDINRNETVYKKQGNRNPFVDIPNLASLISEEVLKSK